MNEIRGLPDNLDAAKAAFRISAAAALDDFAGLIQQKITVNTNSPEAKAGADEAIRVIATEARRQAAWYRG